MHMFPFTYKLGVCDQCRVPPGLLQPIPQNEDFCRCICDTAGRAQIIRRPRQDHCFPPDSLITPFVKSSMELAKKMSHTKPCFILLLVFASYFSRQSQVEATSWVDPTTPEAARTTVGMKDFRTLQLVFSDEFNGPERGFTDGDDTRWTAEDRPAVTNAALHYYNSSHVKIVDGKLAIETTRQDAAWVEYDSVGTEFPFRRNYQSGLLSTWNKFCFTSGVIEISFQLPGKPLRGGLWPAFWMLGNLARAGYLTSTDGIWPWSYDTCGSSQESAEANLVQSISSCNNGKGRGSPEIDIIEAQPGDFVLEYGDVQQVDGTWKSMRVGRPLISSSLQVSPGVAHNLRSFVPNLPQPGEWYPDLFPMGGPAYGELNNGMPHMLNNYWYGQLVNENPPVWQDGMSNNWQHSTSYYTQQTVMRTEWQVGTDDGYVRWFNGDGQLVYEITAETLRRRPGEQDAIPLIPVEPMYLILNTDVSPRWGWNGCNPASECMLANPGLCSPEGELLCRDCADPNCLRCPEETAWLADFCQDIQPNNPARYLIDYVRIYQDVNDATHTLGCDPPGLPTTDYVAQNWQRYTFNSFIKDAPLLPVQNGGASCSSDVECSNGTCRLGECLCDEGWTGPNCYSPCIGDYAVGCQIGLNRTEAPMPSSHPSSSPTTSSSAAPSDVPSLRPTLLSDIPSSLPSGIPSDTESADPSEHPSDNPSLSPTELSYFASDYPSHVPSSNPSASDIPSMPPKATQSEAPTLEWLTPPFVFSTSSVSRVSFSFNVLVTLTVLQLINRIAL